jgi:hypothetical protein
VPTFKGVAGVTEQVPAPLAQPNSVAEKFTEKYAEDPVPIQNKYEVAPAEALQLYVGLITVIDPLGAMAMGMEGMTDSEGASPLQAVSSCSVKSTARGFSINRTNFAFNLPTE